jgi:hypothetical protein
LYDSIAWERLESICWIWTMIACACCRFELMDGSGGRRPGGDNEERRERRQGKEQQWNPSPRELRHAASRTPDEGLADGGVTGHKSGSLAAPQDVCTVNRRENLCKQP